MGDASSTHRAKRERGAHLVESGEVATLQRATVVWHFFAEQLTRSIVPNLEREAGWGVAMVVRRDEVVVVARWHNSS
jgi:hypothetical protein